MKPQLSDVHNPWLTRSARVMEITTEIDGVDTYRLQAIQPDLPNVYRFEPGQFNMLYLPGVGESAISMSGDPAQPADWIHTVRVAGNVTRTLASLELGDTLGIRGPFGTGWPVKELLGNDIVLVAGGLGLAPLRPVIYHLVRHRAAFGNLWLISGARSPAALLFPSEYDAWRQAGIVVIPTVDRADDAWSGLIGVATLPFDRLHLPRIKQTLVLTCGPEVMMKYIALTALRRGIDARHVWVSMERNMQCAVGLCGHCLWGADFVCKDGPVLRYDRIQSYFSVESL